MDEELLEEHEEKDYRVVMGGIISEYEGAFCTNDMKEAVRVWGEKQKEYPTEVAIICKSKAGNNLSRWAKENKEEVETILNSTYVKNVYNIPVLLKMLDNARECNPRFDSCGGDMIFPFCQG